MNKRAVFELAIWIKQEYEKATAQVAINQLPCKDPQVPALCGPREYSPWDKFYIGLSDCQHLWTTEEWTAAFNLLKDWGVLEEDVKWDHHYKYNGCSPDEFKGMFTIDVGPFVDYRFKNLYHQWMKSDAWKKQRDKLLEEKDHKCEICGNYTNHVHHKTYNYDDWSKSELQVLCPECHNKIGHKGRYSND